MAGQGYLTAVKFVTGGFFECVSNEDGGDGSKEASTLSGLHFDACNSGLELVLEFHSGFAVSDLAGLACFTQDLNLLFCACGPW